MSDNHIERNKNQLLYASLPLFLILLGGILYSISINVARGYEKDNKSLQEMVIGKDYLLRYHDYLQRIATGYPEMLLIDLRDRDTYGEGHLENAVNIPAGQLFERESLRKMRRHRQKDIVLYSDSEEKSALAFMMLASLGFENVYVLPGSYAIIQKHVIEEENKAWLFYDAEKAKWNYSLLR